jgi:23S rRNA pseudouridine955/2504/2580 synthase
VKTRAPVLLSDDEIAFVRSRVLCEDAQVLVLDKPAGLSSQGGRIQAHTLDDLLWAFARSNGKRPELVHRLDRDTSGVILAGQTKPALGFLGKAIQGRRLKKTYLALVGGGAPEPRGGDIRLALRREEIGREAFMRTCPDDHPDAQASHSRYRTLAAGDEAALVELSPETGRMHQLRVHLAAIGRPILGDVRYGGALTAGGAAVPRLMLHAAKLDFPHPDGGRKVVEADLPDDMAEVRERLSL